MLPIFFPTWPCPTLSIHLGHRVTNFSVIFFFNLSKEKFYFMVQYFSNVITSMVFSNNATFKIEY